MTNLGLSTSVLAHQGGWDEVLFVLAPLLVFAGLLALARRRVDSDETDPDNSQNGPGGEEGPSR